MNTHPLRHWSGPDLAAARRRVGLHRLALARALQTSPRLVAAWELRREPIPASAAPFILQALRDGRMRQAQRDLQRRMKVSEQP